MVVLVRLKEDNIQRLQKVRRMRRQAYHNNAVLLSILKELTERVTGVVVAYQEPLVVRILRPCQTFKML